MLLYLRQGQEGTGKEKEQERQTDIEREKEWASECVNV